MKNMLLPFPFKLAGIFLTISGLAFAVLYLWFDFRFTLPVFAVFSSFVETKIFATFRTNFADELTMLLLFAGLGLIVFSKEKNESENVTLIRTKALLRAYVTNTVFLLFSILFVYGSGFIGILVLNLCSLPIFYLIIFLFLKRKQSDNINGQNK
jgi:hypothetical protein